MIEFRINTTSQYVNDLSDQLSELGACAISFVDAANQPIYEPLPGEIVLWQDTIIVAHFEEDDIKESISNYLQTKQQAGLLTAFTVNEVDQQDWVRVCLDQFQPQQFGEKLWICPSWCEPPNPHAVNVMLDPGLAFGTGTHPTTKLCLEWLDGHVKKNDTIIDYGCGSGILAVAALKLGATHAFAIDHDPQALDACLLNLHRNNIPSNQLTVSLPNQLELAPCDILIANILAQPLIELAPLFAKLVKKGGKIALSGILDPQSQQVLQIYQTFFHMSAPTVDGEWVRLDGYKMTD